MMRLEIKILIVKVLVVVDQSKNRLSLKNF